MTAQSGPVWQRLLGAVVVMASATSCRPGEDGPLLPLTDALPAAVTTNEPPAAESLADTRSPLEALAVERAARWAHLHSQLQRWGTTIAPGHCADAESIAPAASRLPPDGVESVRPSVFDDEPPARSSQEMAVSAEHDRAESRSELPSALSPLTLPLADDAVDGEIDRLGIADCLFGMGEVSQAELLYAQLRPEAQGPERLWIDYQLAGCRRRQQDLSEAQRRYRDIVAETPDGWISDLARWWLVQVDEQQRVTAQVAGLRELTQPSAGSVTGHVVD